MIFLPKAAAPGQRRWFEVMASAFYCGAQGTEVPAT
jgi:hypothetical protein